MSHRKGKEGKWQLLKRALLRVLLPNFKSGSVDCLWVLLLDCTSDFSPLPFRRLAQRTIFGRSKVLDPKPDLTRVQNRNLPRILSLPCGVDYVLRETPAHVGTRRNRFTQHRQFRQVSCNCCVKKRC
ncbi:hypothetical protein TNCV_2281001 [Trichonephila clavipes]|nr:hypothetical protein TNCV_2281001 [Trichonephila clavipes]